MSLKCLPAVFSPYLILWPIVVFALSCTNNSSVSVFGKWKSTEAWSTDDVAVDPGEIMYEFKKDSTFNGYDDGKLTVKNRRFSIRFAQRPGGRDMLHFIDFGNASAEEELGHGHLETPTVIYIKEGTTDTLYLVTLSPYNGYREEVFSKFYRIE